MDSRFEYSYPQSKYGETMNVGNKSGVFLFGQYLLAGSPNLVFIEKLFMSFKDLFKYVQLNKCIILVIYSKM